MQTEDDHSRLEERLTRIEARLAQLEARLEPEAHAEHVPPSVRSTPARARIGQARTPRFAPPLDWAHLSEQWLGRVGIGLLVLGVAYLFKYSIDQGWLTPGVRIAFGGAVGAGLLGVGLRLQAPRPTYSQILVGGGLAVLYLTTFAAYALYALLGTTAALVLLVALSGVGLLLADRGERPALASLALIGGFAAPFLARGSDDVLMLAGYSLVLLGWTGVVYARHGWPSTLASYTAGALVTLAAALDHGATGAARPTLQAALLALWAASALLPFVRRMRGAAPRPEHAALTALAVGVSGFVVAGTTSLWHLRHPLPSVLLLLGAAAFAVLAQRPAGLRAAANQGAAVLLALALANALRDHEAALVASSAALAAALLTATRRSPRAAGADAVGHLLFLVLALASPILLSVALSDAFDRLALATLGAALLAALASATLGEPLRVRYLAVAYAVLLAALATELHPLGSGWITVAWGAVGAALLVYALRHAARPLVEKAALATLALGIGKLLVADMARVGALWRVLLFLGFGAGLLALASLFKRGDEPLPRRGPATPET